MKVVKASLAFLHKFQSRSMPQLLNRYQLLNKLHVDNIWVCSNISQHFVKDVATALVTLSNRKLCRSKAGLRKMMVAFCHPFTSKRYWKPVAHWPKRRITLVHFPYVMVDSSTTSYEAIVGLFEANLKATSTRDPISGLHPFMMTGSNANITSSFNLLLADPSLVLGGIPINSNCAKKRKRSSWGDQLKDEATTTTELYRVDGVTS